MFTKKIDFKNFSTALCLFLGEAKAPPGVAGREAEEGGGEGGGGEAGGGLFVCFYFLKIWKLPLFFNNLKMVSFFSANFHRWLPW